MPDPIRRTLDPAGLGILLFLAALFGLNNVLIKLGNAGMQPVMFAALRSAIAGAAVSGWMVWRGIDFRLDLWRPGLVLGAFFTGEFLLLFVALDSTSVVRASALFYAMPIWLALLGHVLFPGERLTHLRLLGFALGFFGVVLTLAGRPAAYDANAHLAGDLAALVAGLCWAAVVVTARRSRLSATAPETQMVWQLVPSVVILAALAPLFGGPILRDFDVVFVGLLLIQALGVVALGYVLWFHMLARYQATTVASFSFLTPILSALLGWLLLSEPVAPSTPVALLLLVAGLVLINRKPRIAGQRPERPSSSNAARTGIGT